MSDTLILYSALAILGLPLLSYVLTFFLAQRLPRKGDFIGVTFMGLAELLAIAVFVSFWRIDDPAHRIEAAFPWIDLGGFRIDAGVLVDGMTSIMLLVVCTVSFLVHLYSVGYMHGDRRYERYFAFLGFFTFSMLGIVLANNLFFLYVFWELVGLASYLLIGFFFHKHSAANANKKAFLTNRVGDFGFWLGILAFFTATGTLNYFELFAHVDAGTVRAGLLTWAGVGLFMGCVGKSAQMPLHIWLPDAMEGPTPVSALIHAATMVAAGVYMVARLAPLFGAEAMMVVLYVGAITAFVAATIALVKTDIKRVLAFSTLSQLGYMVMSLGAGDSMNAMFHLTTHAMFKALLFLGAGSVIHALHSQEMPDMGGLRRKMPITFWTFLIATLAISGVPFFAGFYSKDGILGSTLAFGITHGHYLPFVLGIVAAALTPFYMFRIVFLTFFGQPRNAEKFERAHESGWTMTVPLLVLGVMSVIAAGWETADAGWFSRFAQPYDLAAHHETHHDAHNQVHERAHSLAMVLSIVMAGLGILLSWWTYHLKKIDTAGLQTRLSGVHTILQRQYLFDEFYAATVYRLTLAWAAFCATVDRFLIDGIVDGSGYLARVAAWFSGALDRYLIDGAVNGMATVLHGFGEGFRRLQTGRIQTYLVYVAASVLVLVLVYRVL